MRREDHAGDGNAVLRMLLDEAQMSNAALARAVVAAGAEEGMHLGTGVSAVRRMAEGSRPRWPVPRLVAKVLSRRLHREVGVTECGFADRNPTPDDLFDGLTCSATLDGTVRTVVRLSGQDMNRRSFCWGRRSARRRSRSQRCSP